MMIIEPVRCAPKEYPCAMCINVHDYVSSQELTWHLADTGCSQFLEWQKGLAGGKIRQDSEVVCFSTVFGFEAQHQTHQTALFGCVWVQFVNRTTACVCCQFQPSLHVSSSTEPWWVGLLAAGRTEAPVGPFFLGVQHLRR